MSDDQCTPGVWTHPSFDPSKLHTTNKPPVGGTPVGQPDPPVTDTSWLRFLSVGKFDGVEVLRSAQLKPKHKCLLPERGKLEIGAIVRCRSCSRRYEMKRVPPQRVGGGVKAGYVGWVRRYWPWPR